MAFWKHFEVAQGIRDPVIGEKPWWRKGATRGFCRFFLRDFFFFGLGRLLEQSCASMGKVILFEMLYLDWWFFFFFLLWCLKGSMRLAKGLGKKGSKICRFGKRFQAHDSSCFSWLQKNMGRSHCGLKGWAWKSIRSWFFRVSFWKNLPELPQNSFNTNLGKLKEKNLSTIHLFHLFFLLKQSYLVHSYGNDTSLPG